MHHAVIQWDRLQEAATARGDRSRYAISKRTGLSQSVLFRLRHGTGSPSAGTLLTLARTYGLEVDDLLPTVTPVAAPAVDAVRESA